MEKNQIRLMNSGVGKNSVMGFNHSAGKGMVSVYYVLFIIIICLLIAGCGSTSGPAPVIDRTIVDTRKIVNKSDNAGAEKDQYYIVQRGDTLYSIAVNQGIDLRELAEWNNIADTSTIKPGQQISLSVPSKKVRPTIFALPRQPVPSVTEATTESSHLVPEFTTLDPNTKAEPKGLKLPYSEHALAQIQNMPNSAVSMPAISSSDYRANKIARIETAPPLRTQATSSTKLNDSNIEWIWPANGKILEGYSQNSKGIRISGESGQSILASAAGKVVYSGNGLRGYGELVIIKHSDTFLSAYAYNSKLLVKEGDAVAKGQKIAEMGNTDTDIIKLHFEIRKHGKPVDPMSYLPSR